MLCSAFLPLVVLLGLDWILIFFLSRVFVRCVFICLQLQALCGKFSAEGKVKSRRFGFLFHRQVKQSFRGCHLVSFLLREGYVTSRAGALALGQRLVDARLVSRVCEGSRATTGLQLVFEGSRNAFFTLKVRLQYH